MRTKTVIAPVIVTAFFIFILTLATPFNTVADDEIRISSLSDSDIGKEVTVSGVIIALSSNIEPSTGTDEGIQTFEPKDTAVRTIDDGTGRVFVSSDPRVWEKFYKGQRVSVTGIYAGKGIIYADTVSADTEEGYKDVTVKELMEYPQYYYAKSVRIKGNVMRIEIVAGETELEIDDHTGTVDVDYQTEIEDIKISDEVVVEGKFYRNKIYAFAVKAQKQEPEPEPEATPGPEPSPTPVPSPTPSPTPVPLAPTPTPSPTPKVEESGMPLYLIVIIIIAVAAVAGVFIAVKLREWRMLERYGK